MRLRESVVNVGAQRMQRHLSILVLFCTGEFRAVQTARAANLDALSTTFHRGLDCALHSAPEGNSLHQLLADCLGDQLSIDIR